MTTKAQTTLSLTNVVGPVRRRTFGSFVEHLGRCVYDGIHNPEHPSANADGFRTDIMDLVRELGVSTVRYPGGNFVSGYRWEDGIGPVEDRPKRLDLAWHSLEPNTVGVDEFMRWTKATGVEPMMAVNLGTRGVEEALDILEYCNIPGQSYWAEKRKQNGTAEPHRIKMWCLGNEMDGPWQTGHKTAEEYGRLATETARAMRQMEPDLELVACGSSGRGMHTFGEWERIVLTESFDQVDMISAHAYYWAHDGQLQEFLVSAEDMDRFIDSVSATIDSVAAAKKTNKQIGISFDEWNVWYQEADPSQPPSGDNWPVAPHLLEDHYSVGDAVVVGNLLISLLRHTDRVWSASQAQLVNVIAPIMTKDSGEAWKQTIFYPFALTSHNAAGKVVRLNFDGPTIDTEQFGTVAALDGVATVDGENIAIFVANRSEHESISTTIDLPGDYRVTEAKTIAHQNPLWKPEPGTPESEYVKANSSVHTDDLALTLDLPEASWTCITLTAN